MLQAKSMVLVAAFAFAGVNVMAQNTQTDVPAETKNGLNRAFYVEAGNHFGKSSFEAEGTGGESLKTSASQILSPFVVLGLDIRFSKWSIGAGLSSAIPIKSGDLKRTDLPSSYSGDAVLDGDFMMDIRGAYFFYPNGVTVYPTFDVAYRYRKWTARNGKNGSQSFSGVMLSFEEFALYPALGAGAEFRRGNLGSAFELALVPFIYAGVNQEELYSGDRYTARLYGFGGGTGAVYLRYYPGTTKNHLYFKVNGAYLNLKNGDFIAAESGINVPDPQKQDSMDASYWGLTVSAGIGFRMEF